jgi:hypothetical protein
VSVLLTAVQDGTPTPIPGVKYLGSCHLSRPWPSVASDDPQATISSQSVHMGRIVPSSAGKLKAVSLFSRCE